MRAILIAAFAVATSALFLGGCTTTSTDDKKPGDVAPGKLPDDGSGRVTRVEPPAPPGTSAGTPGTPASGARTAARSIYFDYDKFGIKDEYRPIVEQHAKYLRENPGAKMLIQGNADERGSREYNVGLGQRRSDGVKRMLTLLGVKEDQVESVSLGEEKPKAEGHDEDAWAQNRRCDMLYNGEY